MTDAIKTASKRAIQKKAEATGDLIGNKTADKIASVSKKKPTKGLHNNDDESEDVEIATTKKRYISPEERKQIIEELRLVPKKYYKLRCISSKESYQIIYKLRLVL